MNDNGAGGASVTVEEVLHNTAFTKGVETFCDGGGINEKTAAESAANVRKELV